MLNGKMEEQKYHHSTEEMNMLTLGPFLAIFELQAFIFNILKILNWAYAVPNSPC